MARIQKLNRKILSNSRFSLDFFMYTPYGSFTTKDNTSIYLNYNPVLLLKYIPPKYAATQYDYSKATYKITPRNIYKVIKMFNELMKWMYSEEYNDLYMLDNDNNLIFNSDYAKLQTSVTPGMYDQCYIKAYPTVVDLGGKKMEGVNLLINETTHIISLTHEEVALIFNILKNFNFTREVICALEVFRYIEQEKSYGENKWNENRTPFD